MKNPLNEAEVDDGVKFIQFVWAECRPEIENFKQGDINKISKLIYKRTTRPENFTNPKLISKKDKDLPDDEEDIEDTINDVATKLKFKAPTKGV